MLIRKNMINPVRTFKNYRVWKKIILDNKDQLLNKGFLLNWIYQLGLVIKFDDNDIKTLDYIPNELKRLDVENQLLTEKVVKLTRKHDDYFLKIGLAELLEGSEFTVERSAISNYTYYITVSFKYDKFSKFYEWLVYLGCIGILIGILKLIF